MDENKKNPQLIPLSKWSLHFADPPTGALRWMVFINRDGFRDRCVVYRGKRVLIDVEQYFRWLNDLQPKKPKAA